MARLEEICSLITDGSHFSPEDEGVGYPMFSVKDMTPNGFNISGCKKIGEEAYKKLVANGCKPLNDDVVVAKDGSYLKTAFVIKGNPEITLLSSIAILRPKIDSVVPEYLSYFLKSDAVYRTVSLNYITGTALKRIILKGIRKIEVDLPDIGEQEQRAQRLSKVDYLCQLRKQQLAKLDELVKARFVEMFDAISPKKCASKIGECAEVLGGYAFKSDCFSNQGVPVVRIGNINDGRIDIDYNTCYAEEFWNKNPRFQARKYDILMAMSGATTGKVGIYKSDERLLINQRVACIRARDDESAIFLFACLQLPWMYNLVQEASAGCAQPNISGKQIETMPVPKPETSKVHQFAAFVERVDQQKQTIQQSLEKLELMKKVLMQEYFG